MRATQRFLTALTVIFMLTATAVAAYAASPNTRINTLRNSITPDGYVSNGGLDFRVIFSQPVKGLEEAGIEIVKFPDSIRNYVWEVRPLNPSPEGFTRKYHISLDFVGEGSAYIKVLPNAAQNSNGEGNAESAQKRYKIDTKIPKVSYISTPNAASGSFPAVLGISEEAYLMDEGAIQVIGASSWRLTNSTNGVINQLRLEITPANGVTEVRISVSQYCFIDKGGNYNPRSMSRVVNIQ